MSTFPRLSKTGLAGILVFAMLTTMPVIDSDYFWHLKTGEYILAHAALPTGDIFSFTREGQPWVLHEWLFEVLLYQVSATCGDLGVKLLVAGLGSAALALAFTLARRVSGSAAAAWIPAVLALVLIAGGIAPRPQMLTYVCFTLYLSALLAFKYAGATRPLFVLPLVMVVWVNAHAAYAVGIMLVCLFAACEWLRWFVQPVRDQEQRRRLLRLAQAAGLVVLASLANPGMFERWLYPIQVLGMSANDFIQEWQSPNFHRLVPKLYLALILLFLVSCTYAIRKPDLTELALPLFFAVLGCISVRHVPLATLTLLPFTAQALARGPLDALGGALRAAGPVRWYLARRGAGKELGTGEFVLNWIVACGAAAWIVACQSGPAPERGIAPAKGAADFVEAHHIGGRLFNQYADGGYLIYRLAPHAKVVIDGRADVYGDAFIKDFQHIYQGGADWQAKFERLAVDFAVLPLNAPIRQLLLASGRFHEVYRDKRFSVLQRGASSTALASS